MKNNKIVVARIYHKYQGRQSADNAVISGVNPDKFETLCIYLTKNSNIPNSLNDKEGIKCIYLANRRNFRIFSFPILFKLAGILKQNNADIVHCCCCKSVLYGALAAKIAKIKAVIGQFDVLDKMFEKPNFIFSFILKSLWKIIAVGDFVKADIIKGNPEIPHEEIVNIPHTIDISRFEDVPISKKAAREKLVLPNDSIVFGAVGKLIPSRNIDLLIDSFSDIKNKYHNVHLLLVGGGSYEEQLKEKAAESGFADAIHFVGNRDDVPMCLKAIDIFISPASNQGFPQSVLEAMASRLPCIAARSGAIPEIFENSKNGFVFTPNDKNSLVSAMLESLELPYERMLQLKQNAYNRCKEFYSQKTAIAYLENIYSSR